MRSHPDTRAAFLGRNQRTEKGWTAMLERLTANLLESAG